jgi:hypothetical protein
MKPQEEGRKYGYQYIFRGFSIRNRFSLSKECDLVYFLS